MDFRGFVIGLVIIAIIATAAILILEKAAQVEANTVIELVSCKNVGAVAMMKKDTMPQLLVDAVETNPNFMIMKDFALIKYVGFGEDNLQIPPGDEWGILYTTAASTDEWVYDEEEKEWVEEPLYHGEAITGFAISGFAYKPTEASQMAGDKYWFSIEKLRAISDLNDPIGVSVYNPDFNENFTPGRFTPDFIDSAACWFTVWIGDKPNSIRCSETGYMPDTNFQMQGVAKVEGSGMYIVKACSSGIWIESITSMNPEDWSGMSGDSQNIFTQVFNQVIK